jgi:hypothetical protein
MCGTHVESFALTRGIEHLEVTRCGLSKRPEARFSGRETGGKCAICPEMLKPKEARASCVNCGYCAHASCIVAQLEDGDWGPVADRSSLELLCVGCVVERAGEVGAIRRILLSEGVGGFGVFDPTEDTFMGERGRALWEGVATPAVHKWAVCTPNEGSASPWKTSARPLDVSGDLPELAEPAVLAVMPAAPRAEQAGAAPLAGAGAALQARPALQLHARGSLRAAGIPSIEEAFAALEAKFERLRAQQGCPERVAPQLPMALAFFSALGRVGGSSVCVRWIRWTGTN